MSRVATELLNDDPLLTTGDVARLMRVDQKTVSRWVLAGLIPAIKTPGGRWRMRRSVVDALLSP